MPDPSSRPPYAGGSPVAYRWLAGGSQVGGLFRPPSVPSWHTSPASRFPTCISPPYHQSPRNSPSAQPVIRLSSFASLRLGCSAPSPAPPHPVVNAGHIASTCGPPSFLHSSHLWGLTGGQELLKNKPPSLSAGRLARAWLVCVSAAERVRGH
jgi:hypothetical protein